MVDRTSEAITPSEIEFSQPAFRFDQFRKLHIFQDCHVANIILPADSFRVLKRRHRRFYFSLWTGFC